MILLIRSNNSIIDHLFLYSFNNTAYRNNHDRSYCYYLVLPAITTTFPTLMTLIYCSIDNALTIIVIFLL